MDNQFDNGQNNPQNYGATMPVDNPGFVQPQYNSQNYGATMPVDNPGFSQPQYNSYGATMPVNNPGFDQPQYNNQGYGATMPVDNSGYGATMPVDNQGFNQPQYNGYGTTTQTGSPNYNQPLPPQQQNINAAGKKKKTGSKMSVGWLVALCISLIVIVSGALIITFVVLGKKKQIKNVKNTEISLTNGSYSVTYGELFKNTVKNLEWDYFKEDGEKLVQAKGDYQIPDTGSTVSLVVQFNVDNGVRLSCISVDGQAYSLSNSELFIESMYNLFYGIKGSIAGDSGTPLISGPNVTTEATTQATTEATTQATTEATTQATTEATTEEKNEYILKNSSSEYLAVSDIAGMSKDQCRLARNEIYARHGRLFDDPELQAYFNSCSWYVGYIEPGKFDESVFNAYEKANLELIVQYEKDMGYR